MWKDPIVEEVRKHRKEIELECNGEFSLLFARAKEIEKSMKDRLTSKVKKKKVKGNSKLTE